ncbi:M23 family metallopeptidase [Nocardia uniformis]|uniref:M23 family metallopeptidase n=2 Tax=Nocardia uniformis TaxID=53432 RepID=A0A849BUW7_9NOCA|nr:M23 family metallopeptidase [Nocardia uniformis]
MEPGPNTRHRVDTGLTGRIRAAAGAAVAAGALIATTSAQLTSAVATAAPLPPADHEADRMLEPAAEPVPAADVEEQAVYAVPSEIPGDTAEVAPAAAPVATPFGLVGLPVEISGPLAQAEQAIKELQQQFAPPAVAPAAPAPAAAAPAAVAPAATPFGLAGLPPEISGPLAQAEQAIKDLQQRVAPPAQAPRITAAPAVLPVAGAISSGFGSRWGAFHYGVDIADTLGTPIHSAMGGTVIEAGPASGFGLWVRVLQDDGTTAVYGHVNDMYVQAGQRVNAGDVIATVGNRGQSTGPHLHLEIWNPDGSKIDPVAWLAAKGVLMEQRWGAH